MLCRAPQLSRPFSHAANGRRTQNPEGSGRACSICCESSAILALQRRSPAGIDARDTYVGDARTLVTWFSRLAIDPAKFSTRGSRVNWCGFSPCSNSLPTAIPAFTNTFRRNHRALQRLKTFLAMMKNQRQLTEIKRKRKASNMRKNDAFARNPCSRRRGRRTHLHDATRRCLLSGCLVAQVKGPLQGDAFDSFRGKAAHCSQHGQSAIARIFSSPKSFALQNFADVLKEDRAG